MGLLRFTTEFGVQGNGGPTHVVATDGTYLAFALPGGPSVELQCLRNPAQAPVRLVSEMQQRPVISICFGSGPLGTSDPAPNRQASRRDRSPSPTCLFCGSWDAVVAWNVSAVLAAVASGHPPPPPIQVMSDQGPVYCMTYGSRLSYLAVGTGPDVNIFDVRTFRHLYRLDGHSADVLAASFCPPPSSPHLLVTAGADRTFKIWDLEAGSMVVQSAVLGAAPLTCLALEPSHPPRLVLGAADGCLRFFDLSGLPAARQLQVVDVGRQLGRAVSAAAAVAAEAAAAASAGPKVISSRPAWKAAMGLQRQPSTSESDPEGGGDDDEDDQNGALGSSSIDGLGNTYVLALAYTQPPPPPPPPAPLLPDILPGGELGGGAGPLLLPGCPSLLVAMSGAVAVLDTRSYDVVETFLLGRAETPGVPSAASAPSLAALARRPSGGDVGAVNTAGALAAPPPPPPTLRPRLALRGMPRVESCGCVAFAPLTATSTGDKDGPPRDGVNGSGSGSGVNGVLCCTAASREPTVAVLRYEATDGPSPSSAGLSTAAVATGSRRPVRSLSGQALTNGAVPSHGRLHDTVDDAVDGCDDGDDGAGAGAGTLEGGDLVLSVFQSAPLPADSPLRAASPAGPGPGSAAASGGGGGGAPNGRRSSSAGASRPGGGGGGVGSAAPCRGPSPGRAAARPPLASGSPSKGGKGGGGIKNQPVTFHAKVKSSGYGVMHPPTLLGRAPPPAVKLGRPAAVSSVGRHLVEARQYPVGCGPLTEHQPRNCLARGEPVHPGGAIVRIAFSSDASRLLTASVNRTARVMKLPLSRWGGEGTDLVGHNGPLHGTDWSREGTMVLSASADRTARLWNAACAQPLLEFSHLNTQPPPRPPGTNTPTAGGATRSAMPPPAPASPASAAARAPNPLLPHEVRAARFVYMDQFIAIACGNKLLLYRYKLVEDPDSDIERLRARHTYRLLATHTSQAQALLDFSTVNSFLSPLAIASASNRGLELIDLAVMRPLATVSEAHVRPVGCVAQAGTASLFVSHPREAYELFATSAPDNTVKLWDVRSPQRCVRSFVGHKNSQLPSMAISFSPCLRYLATGSEDKQAYLYDVRQGVVAHRIGRGVVADAVTGVAFNPLHPQLAVSCLDGRVAFFSDGST